MASNKLTKLVQKQIQESTEYWAGKPKMTPEEFAAVEKFAKEKEVLFAKIFDSPEKVEKVQAMYKEALNKI